MSFKLWWITKHQPDNRGTFPVNDDDNNWHQCLQAVDDKILFRIPKNTC